MTAWPRRSARPGLARLRGLVAGSPIRVAPAAPPRPLRGSPCSLSWDETRHSPELDRLILNWIVGHVPPDLRRAH